MSALNKYDYQQFAKTPVARTIHRAAQKSLPEMGTFPSVVLDGESYDTPVLIKKGESPIFCKVSEGACGSKSEFDFKRNTTFGFDQLVTAPVRAAATQSKEQKDLLGMDRFNYEVADATRNIFSQTVNQLYSGVANEADGFEGLPAAVTHKIDALDGEWNGAADFDSSDITTAGMTTGGLFSVYLLRVAESATLESPGLKWVWGNGATINEGETRIEEVIDEALVWLGRVRLDFRVRRDRDRERSLPLDALRVLPRERDHERFGCLQR